MRTQPTAAIALSVTTPVEPSQTAHPVDRLPAATLPPTDQHQTGWRLMTALMEQARTKGDSLRMLGAALDCNPSYLMQLHKGQRSTLDLSQDLVVALANYLGVMPAVVKLLAEQVTLDDFVLPDSAEDAVLERAVASMARDPLLGALVPADLGRLSREDQRFVVACYEQASGHELTAVPLLPEPLVRLFTALKQLESAESH